MDKQFALWFASDDIFTNMATVIRHISVEETRLTVGNSQDIAINHQRDVTQMFDDSDDDMVDALPGLITPGKQVINLV